LGSPVLKDTTGFYFVISGNNELWVTDLSNYAHTMVATLPVPIVAIAGDGSAGLLYGLTGEQTQRLVRLSVDRITGEVLVTGVANTPQNMSSITNNPSDPTVYYVTALNTTVKVM
jgi:hypothetical protein